jgi:hypothetical protein
VRARHVTYYTISDNKHRPEKTSSLRGLNARPSANQTEKKQVLAGDRTLGLPRVKRTICQLSYENHPSLCRESNPDLLLRREPCCHYTTEAPKKQQKETSAGFEPAPPKGTDFESVTLTTPSRRPPWRLGASIPLPVECESTALPLELNPPKQKNKKASSPGIEPGSQR